MISQYQTWSKSCLLVLGPHDIQRCSGPDCMPRDIGHGTRLGAWSSPVLRRASAGDILWLKASPNWNWQNFGDQWGKFLHFLGRTRIPGWKNILFSWLQTVWHSTGLTRSVDPDFVRNAEVWIDPGGSRSHLWRRWKPAIPTPKLAPLILVDLLHPPEIGWHFQKNNHVNGTKPAMGAAMRILCFTDITSFSWNPLKANCDQTVEPFFLISVLTWSQTYLAHRSSFTNGPFFETNCVQIRWRRHSDDLSHSIILCIYHVLVGGFNPSEKYESQLGLLFPIYGKS